MKEKNSDSKNKNPSRPDVAKEYTDSIGRKLRISVEYKIFNDRLDIAAVTIRTTDLSSPITRRMLSEIPLDKLFRNELAVEADRINLLRSRGKRTTAHQGRQHSDEDLQRVAEIYKSAFQARLPVQKAVADALGISVSAATKRIMAARRRGFIASRK